jgi:hypothetical protein
MTTTWNPSYIPASISLSGGNLTWTQAISTTFTVPATGGFSTGKLYFEVLLSSVTSDCLVGITNQSTGSATVGLGLDAHGFAYDAATGKVYNNNTAFATGSYVTYTSGDRVMVAVDLVNNLLYVGKNGTWSLGGNPSAGTGGISIPANTYFPAFGAASSRSNGTANFGATAFTYSLPTGYSAWDVAIVDDLAASAIAQATATATLDVEHNLAASAASIASATSAIDVQNHLGALAAAVATGTGALDLKHHLAAAAASIATVMATLTSDPSGVEHLAASAVSVASATASLDLQHHLAGAAAAISTAVASLDLQHPLSADAAASSVAAAGLRLAHHLAGAAIAEPLVTAGLVGPTDTPVRPSPMISLRWSDDRGATFGNPVEQSMGGAGEFLTSIKWNRLGMARDRVFELSWSCNSNTCLSGAFIETIKHKS